MPTRSDARSLQSVSGRYADKKSEQVIDLLDQVCKLKRKHAALQAGLDAKNKAYDNLAEDYKRVKLEKNAMVQLIEKYQEEEDGVTEDGDEDDDDDGVRSRATSSTV